MSEEMEFGPDILVLTDDDGEEHEFEVLDSLDTDNGSYVALAPVFEEGQELLDDDGQLVILKAFEDEEGEYFEAIQDEAEFDSVAAIFMERLQEDFDFIDEEEGE